MSIENILNKNEAALIFTPQNRFYLTGFNSSYGILLISKTTALLLVDGRYFESASKSAKNCEVALLSDLGEQLKEFEANNSIERVFCEKDISVADFNSFAEKFTAKVSAPQFLSNELLGLRSVKSQSEIDCIKKAQEIAEKALLETFKVIKEGITEKQIAAELEYKMKLFGADGISFDTIAISVSNTSLPHGVPTDKKIKKGEFVTVDFGAIYKGYHSDMTRTFAINNATAEMKNIYDTVLLSNETAIKRVKAGVGCFEVDKAARDVITDRSFGDFFVHSTGHGVGIDIHESPNITKKNENILKENQVITIEPGIYIYRKNSVLE